MWLWLLKPELHTHSTVEIYLRLNVNCVFKVDMIQLCVFNRLFRILFSTFNWKLHNVLNTQVATRPWDRLEFQESLFNNFRKGEASTAHPLALSISFLLLNSWKRHINLVFWIWGKRQLTKWKESLQSSRLLCQSNQHCKLKNIISVF